MRGECGEKSVAETVKGTLLAAFGMLLLTTGVNVLAGTISPINAAFQSAVSGAGAQRPDLYGLLWRRRRPDHVYRPDSSADLLQREH